MSAGWGALEIFVWLFSGDNGKTGTSEAREGFISWTSPKIGLKLDWNEI